MPIFFSQKLKLKKIEEK